MMDAAYDTVRNIVEGTFSTLAAERRVLHFNAKPRAHRLVQQEIEEGREAFRPAIQLYPPDKIPSRDPAFHQWSALVAIITVDPDEVIDLASDLINKVEPKADEPKLTSNVTTEFRDGPGYEVVLVRFRFKQRKL